MNRKLHVLLAVLLLSILLASCSHSAKDNPPDEYEFVKHYILNMDVYVDETSGELYLFKPGMGTFKVWNIVADPPEFIRAQIVQGEN